MGAAVFEQQGFGIRMQFAAYGQTASADVSDEFDHGVEMRLAERRQLFLRDFLIDYFNQNDLR